MRIIVTAALLLALSVTAGAQATCRNVWVDHDYNSATPPGQRQVCDSTLSLPAINLPGVQPIKHPPIKPIAQPGLPPLGTTQCRTQSVFENGRWVDRRLCQ